MYDAARGILIAALIALAGVAIFVGFITSETEPRSATMTPGETTQ